MPSTRTAVPALVVGLSGLALAQVAPGPEFQVNTFTTGPQRDAVVASSPDGGFVIAWQSGSFGTYDTGYYTQDGSCMSVHARRYDATGEPRTGELQVNTHTLGCQLDPAVAADGDGDFVVVWQDGANIDSPDDGIFGQRFDRMGDKQGGEFRVETEVAGYRRTAAVARTPTGDFVVVWRNIDPYGQGSPGRDRDGLFGQRFQADGTPVGAEFQVNAVADDAQYDPAVGVDASGNFVVVWANYLYAEDAGWRIAGRRFDANGVPLSGDFEPVADQPGTERVEPDVAVAQDGAFVVVWREYQADGGDTAVAARRFEASGVPAGDAFVVDASPGDSPSVSVDGAGDFVVAWSAYVPGAGSDIVARRFVADGTPRGDSFVVNELTTGTQWSPDVASDAAGNFVVVWSSGDDDDQDGSRAGVFARRFVRTTCAEDAECEDGNGCTTNACEMAECAATLIPGCLACEQEGDCDTGCRLGPDTCLDGACRAAAGCPDVRVDWAAASGATGAIAVDALLAPGDATRSMKMKARLRIATAVAGERRCRSGKPAASPARGKLVPGAPLVLEVGLNRRAERCLEAAGAAGLPVELTVIVRRGHRLVLRRTEPYVWSGG